MAKYLNLEQTIGLIGQTVVIKGWVAGRRNMGKIVFLDLRDRSGVLQTIGVGQEMDAVSIEEMNRVRLGWLVEVEGVVQKRNAKSTNEAVSLGEVEILIKRLAVISESEALPFEVEQDTSALSENLRLQYRYLDLRSERLKNNLWHRHLITQFLRNYFTKAGFWEVETPYLTKGTPEGAREFIIPSRLHKGSFYVLPQSPQQFKQLLMVAGVEKYFQVARCFRDEDQRGDRQPEFTQFDLEMSFVEQEDILQLLEKAMIDLVAEHFPEHRIQQLPFPRLTYAEAMAKYQSDKPDLRENKEEQKLLSFAWVVDFPMFEMSESDGKIGAVHHPFTRPQKEDEALLDKEPLKARAEAYDLVLNGFEIGGGSLRIFEKELQHKIFRILGLSEEEITTRFGHMLEAFKFAPPPHGGLALGLDRLVAILMGEKNIREVIAFPKTSDAKDLLMGAPSDLSKDRLDEAHVKTV